MAAIGFDEVLGIQGAAMVINQMHESHTPTHRWVMSLRRTSPPSRALPTRPADQATAWLSVAGVSSCHLARPVRSR